MSKYHKQLSNHRWEWVRRAILKRDGFRCRQCQRPGRLEVDHVQSLKRGGAAWDFSNLQVLCRLCHLQKTRHENVSALTVPGQKEWRELIETMVSG